MGLVKTIAGSAFSYLDDLWEDYIYCDPLDGDTLVQKGCPRKNSGVGNNLCNNIITEGSRIAVNEGQMLVAVENGMIIDFTAEQGGYEYRIGTSPTMFCGSFGEALKTSLREMGGISSFGGQPTNDRRVYFINTKEILNSRFDFGDVPYRDSEHDITIMLQGSGEYSYEITDPIVFYTNVCGNVADKYNRYSIESLLQAEIQSALLPVLEKIAENGVHYDRLLAESEEIISQLQEQLAVQWKKDLGVEIINMRFINIFPNDESVDKIRQLQESGTYQGSSAASDEKVGAAQADEFMKGESLKAENTWTCSCGMVNTMMFCPQCGSKKPDKILCQYCRIEIPAQFAEMRFCPNCGKER